MTTPVPAADPKRYGVYPVVSEDEPLSAHVASSQCLLQFLDERAPLEDQVQSQIREEVLFTLSQLVRQFVYNVSVRKGFSEAMAREAGGTLYTFGSYRLGVIDKGGDIDALCVVPRHISIDDFFSEMVELLRGRSDIEKLSPVKEATVPIITFYCRGIDIDFAFAHVELSAVPDGLDLLDDRILTNLDANTVKALNGVRVTDMLLTKIPPSSLTNFRQCLRALKYWAKIRGIYSNKLGYFGGVNWAIISAVATQMYPTALPAFLLMKAFEMLYNWKWPTPLMLCDIRKSSAGLSFPIWNPAEVMGDKFHVMPIITPAYPAMNSTYNVSRSTKAVLLTEFKRSIELCGILMTKFELSERTHEVLGKGEWEGLFEPTDFFFKYGKYIIVEAKAATTGAHMKWSAWIESRLRLLVKGLEQLNACDPIHPHPRQYQCSAAGVPMASDGAVITTFFVGFNIIRERLINKTLDISRVLQEFKQNVYGYKDRSNDMEIHFYVKQKKELPSFVFDGLPPTKPKKRPLYAAFGGDAAAICTPPPPTDKDKDAATTTGSGSGGGDSSSLIKSDGSAGVGDDDACKKPRLGDTLHSDDGKGPTTGPSTDNKAIHDLSPIARVTSVINDEIEGVPAVVRAATTKPKTAPTLKLVKRT